MVNIISMYVDTCEILGQYNYFSTSEIRNRKALFLNTQTQYITIVYKMI